MKEKKHSADWYIAATHWLTAGFAIPLIIMLVLGVPFLLLLNTENLTVISAVSSLLMILGISLGIIYSSKFLNKTYFIKNANRIVIISTIYEILVGVGFRIHNFIKGEVFVVDYIGFVVIVILFYLLSKKYVKNNI